MFKCWYDNHLYLLSPEVALYLLLLLVRKSKVK